YYHTVADTTPQQAIFTHKYENCMWFNRIQRDLSGYPADVYKQAENIDSFVIQGAPGIKNDVTIKLPASLPDAVIHKATLELNLLYPATSSVFTYPVQLIVKALDEEGNEYDILDKETTGGFEYIGGVPVIADVNGTE